MPEEQNTKQNEDTDEFEEVLLDIEEDGEETTQDQIAAEQAKSSELFDRLQRLQAEFDNYRKRMENHILEARKFASEEVLLRFLEIYDNFLRALDMEFETNPVSVKSGLEAIKQQFDKTLQVEGVRPIESIGKMFDPYYQHAVNRANDPDKPAGIILIEYQRGYMLREKVLRPAAVCVNHHDTQPTPVKDENESETKSDENGE